MHQYDPTQGQAMKGTPIPIKLRAQPIRGK